MNADRAERASLALFRQVQDIVNQCSAARDFADIHRTLSCFAQALGYELFLLLLVFSSSSLHHKTVFIHNHPLGWRKRYASKLYCTVDPIFAHCRRHTTPLRWDAEATELALDAAARRFMDEARSFGLSSGISFPLHGAGHEWGYLSLNSPADRAGQSPDEAHLLALGSLFSRHVQEAVRRVALQKQALANDPHLTRREKECLFWASEGKTSWETGRILEITERTVVYHMQNAMSKLQTNSRIQAATRALVYLATDPELLEKSLDPRHAPDLFVEVSAQPLSDMLARRPTRLWPMPIKLDDVPERLD